VFREHDCELPANAMFERTNKRDPQAIRCMLLSSELRKPIEKSVCLAILFAPSLILRVGGKQLDIAAAKR
jgi:hypothetical protein